MCCNFFYIMLKLTKIHFGDDMMKKNKNTSATVAPQNALSHNEGKSIVLKLFYDIEGEKKEQMYRELEVMREQRHLENEAAK